MSIDMYTTEKTKCTVYHDLNFQKPKYESIQSISIKNPSQALLQILRETGPVASEEDARAAKVRKTNDGKKKKTAYDIEKMADAMTKLNEDDLLIVIQMIHDHKTEETYTKNDMEAGEFTVDLYTMPENLIRMIWEFLVSPSHPVSSTYLSRRILSSDLVVIGRKQARPVLRSLLVPTCRFTCTFGEGCTGGFISLHCNGVQMDTKVG